MLSDWGQAGRTWHRYPFGTNRGYTACGRVTPLAKRPTALGERPEHGACKTCVADEAKSAAFAAEQAEATHA